MTIVKNPESSDSVVLWWKKKADLLRFASFGRNARRLTVWENNLGKWKREREREGGKKGKIRGPFFFSCCACGLHGYQ